MSGDFCDIAKPDFYANSSVVEYLSENDPEHLRQDTIENEYGLEVCPEDWADG